MSHPLRTYRLRTGITATDLAARLGVSKATVSRLESGKQGISLSLALRIEHATGGTVSPRAFIIVPISKTNEAAT